MTFQYKQSVLFQQMSFEAIEMSNDYYYYVLSAGTGVGSLYQIMSTQNEDLFKQIEEIRDGVVDCESQLNDLLNGFGWTKEELMKAGTKPKSVPKDDSEKEMFVQEKQKDTVASVNEKHDLDALARFCASIDQKASHSSNYADINRLKRDLKRRRMKYRTTKTAPLTYTEELRELIQLQMEFMESKTD